MSWSMRARSPPACGIGDGRSCIATAAGRQVFGALTVLENLQIGAAIVNNRNRSEGSLERFQSLAHRKRAFAGSLSAASAATAFARRSCKARIMVLTSPTCRVVAGQVRGCSSSSVPPVLRGFRAHRRAARTSRRWQYPTTATSSMVGRWARGAAAPAFRRARGRALPGARRSLHSAPISDFLTGERPDDAQSPQPAMRSKEDFGHKSDPPSPSFICSTERLSCSHAFVVRRGRCRVGDSRRGRAGPQARHRGLAYAGGARYLRR